MSPALVKNLVKNNYSTPNFSAVNSGSTSTVNLAEHFVIESSTPDGEQQAVGDYADLSLQNRASAQRFSQQFSQQFPQQFSWQQRLISRLFRRPLVHTAQPDNVGQGLIRLQGGVHVDQPAAERLAIIRTSIQRLNLASGSFHHLLVTSSVPGEGKSLISCNLARSFAVFPGSRVLLVDCDVRKPSLHTFFGIPAGVPGYSDIISGRAQLSSVVHRVEAGLDLITAGSHYNNVAPLFEINALRRFFSDIKRTYNYSVIDTSPVLLCPDPIPLSCTADGVLLVVRGWLTERRLVHSAVNAIGKDRIIGVVMNDADDEIREYGYYGYYGRPEVQGSAATQKTPPTEFAVPSPKQNLELPAAA